MYSTDDDFSIGFGDDDFISIGFGDDDGFLEMLTASGTCTCGQCAALECEVPPFDDDFILSITSDGPSFCISSDGSAAGSFAVEGPTLGDPTVCESLCDSSSCETFMAEASSKNDCFHEDTLINYKGTEYTLAQLQAGAEPECHVPHQPLGRGLTIATSCGRNVTTTETHLVVTPRGHQLAHTLRPGDELFGDFTGEQKCVVTSVTRATVKARFFGLNCVHSEVLANGLRTSTFGDFHTLPAWYMYYAGLLLGPEAASRLGDTIADAFFEYY